jgi:predicted MFS family arabinose efflux permease
MLLSTVGYAPALFGMAAALAVVLLGSMLSLPPELGKSKAKSKFKGIISKTREVNVLSGARLFLFGARDIWFVVGVPVFLSTSLGFSFTQVGSFLALWVVGYGAVQALAPTLISRFTQGHAPQGRAARVLAFLLAATMALVAASLGAGLSPTLVLLLGLGAFGFVFAVNSSVHSYLILAYSDGDKVAMNVGFYYMANAAGRLVGTLLSGLTFQLAGVRGCLWASAAFAVVAGILSMLLPHRASDMLMTEMKPDGGSD